MFVNKRVKTPVMSCLIWSTGDDGIMIEGVETHMWQRKLVKIYMHRKTRVITTRVNLNLNL